MDLQKVTLNLHSGDFDRMRVAYPKLGAGKAIRELVRKHLEKVEQVAQVPAEAIQAEGLLDGEPAND